MTSDTQPRRHEDTKTSTLKVATSQSPEIEALLNRVIGCCIAVHKALGPGLLESVYSRALCIEFNAVGIPYECEKAVNMFYRGEFLCAHRLDIVVAGAIVLEIKCVERIQPVHHAQLLGYLRASHLPVGLLVNFNVAVLRDGLKRIVM